MPDRLNGRFELIVLHLALLLDRLAQDPALRHLEQAIFDHFCRDMDHNLREMGVGDLAQCRPRFSAWARPSMAVCKPTGWHWRRPDDDRLAEAVARNIYGVAGRIPTAARLAGYMREAVRDLEGQGFACAQPAVYSFPSR